MKHHGKIKIKHAVKVLKVSRSGFYEYMHRRPSKQQVEKGNPYDNAMMESFYKTLKRELINDAHFETRAEATQEIFKYIETYYNTKRMHSGLDYKSPKDLEKYNS